MTVERITDHRVFAPGKMDTNLVGAPGVDNGAASQGEIGTGIVVTDGHAVIGQGGIISDGRAPFVWC